MEIDRDSSAYVAQRIADAERAAFRRGAVAAAAVASSYDSSSTHAYRLGDCILSKMNLRKAKPRKNTRKVVLRGE